MSNIFWIVNTALLQGVILFLCIRGKRLKAANKRLMAERREEVKRGQFNRAVHNRQLKILLHQAVERRKQLVRLGIRK